MDEASLVMLSRYLDGDLTAIEEKKLEARLQEDGELRVRLQALEKTRLAVRDQAASEVAPTELDRLVDPLVRGRPPQIAARPWARWLATAAAAILGLTVMLEVNRQRPVSPPVDRYRSSEPAHGATPTARFSLAPLPTSSLPPEERLVGVGDRLIASPIPDLEFEASPPLEVAGPLSQPIDAEGARPPQTGALSAAEGMRAAADSTSAAVATTEPPAGDFDRDDTVATTTARRPSEKAQLGHEFSDRGPAIGAKLFVFLGDRTEWRPFDPKARCKSGRYAVRVRVESGRVVEVWPLGAATSPTPQDRLCAGELTMGLELEAVPDGEHLAEVLIEREDSGR